MRVRLVVLSRLRRVLTAHSSKYLCRALHGMKERGRPHSRTVVSTCTGIT